MSPPLVSRNALRAVSRSSSLFSRPLVLPRCQNVRNSSTNDYSKMPKKETPGPGPNSESLPHVTEEAAAMGKITGDKSAPDASEGTPVQEVLKRDPEMKAKAPEVMKDAVNSSKPSGSRSYSTLVQRNLPEDNFFKEVDAETEYVNAPGAEHAQLVAPEGSEPKSYLTDYDRWLGKVEPRVKFGMPDKTKVLNMTRRYEDIVQQMSLLLTKHGKKSKAETSVARILNNLRMSRPPVINSARPLIPGAPPAHHLPLNPVLYMALAVDSIAPLVRMKSLKGVAGGGRALLIPVPLELKKRRRFAIAWIIDSAIKKPFKGSGKGGLAQKVSDELIAIIEGRSSIWQKRTELHKQGVTARANLSKTGRGGRKR